MKGGALRAIAPLRVEHVPPEGAVQIGVAPGNRPIYQMTLVRGKSEPKWRVDANGEPILDSQGNKVQEMELHPTTAKPSYGRRRLRRVEIVKTFVCEQDGQGNEWMVDYRVPTPEEIAEQERDQKIKEMGGGALGAAMVDQGLTAEQVIQLLLNTQARAASTEPEQAPAKDEPRRGKGRQPAEPEIEV